MKTLGTAFGVLLVFAIVAHASPALLSERSSLGGGLYGYRYYISNDDGEERSYAITLSFQGLIQQLQDGGTEVNSEPAADVASGCIASSYAKSLDSWSYAAWQEIPGWSKVNGSVFTGYQSGDDWFEMSLGTGAVDTCGGYGDNVSVAYIVSGESAPAVSGRIARAGLLYGLDGILLSKPARIAEAPADTDVLPAVAVPEPLDPAPFRQTGLKALRPLEGVFHESFAFQLAMTDLMDAPLELRVMEPRPLDRGLSISLGELIRLGPTIKAPVRGIGEVLPVPEPASLVALGIGALGLLRRGRVARR